MMEEEEEHFSYPVYTGSSSAWMLSFADLLSLMLTFFVLLFALSSLEAQKFKEMSRSMMQRLNPLGQMITDDTQPPKDQELSKNDLEIARDLDYLYTIITEKINAAPSLKGTLVTRLDDRVIVTLPADTFFAPGDAYLTSDAKSAVFLLGEIVSTIGNSVDVNGHTDPAPVGTNTYPSNWELSLSRAATVASAFTRSGYTHPIHVFGYGDSRYDELPKSIPDPTRRALARRVDVAIRDSAARNQ